MTRCGTGSGRRSLGEGHTEMTLRRGLEGGRVLMGGAGRERAEMVL